MNYDPMYGFNRFRALLENPGQIRQNPMAALGGLFGLMAPPFAQRMDTAFQKFGQMPGLGMMFGGQPDFSGFGRTPAQGSGGVTTTTTLADGTVIPGQNPTPTPTAPTAAGPSGMQPFGGYGGGYPTQSGYGGGYPTQSGYGGSPRQSSYGGGYGRAGDEGGNAMSRIYSRRSAY